VSDQLVNILEGNTFVVSDDRGDIEASATDPTGLFSFDTRFLSHWVLTVNGERLTALSTDDLQYFQARFFLVPGTGTVYVDSDMSVIREREVADGFHEDIRVLNHENYPVDLVLRLEAAADFADLFEVKDALKKKGSYRSQVIGNNLVLGYKRETYTRETWISASTPADIDSSGMTFRVKVAAHGEWSTGLDVVASASLPDGPTDRPTRIRPSDTHELHRDMSRGLDKWLRHAPTIE
jgi:glycogen debranching enzyme